MKSQEIAYIILSFIITATFISVFFFTYVSSVEADIIKSQISNVIEDFVNSTNLVLTPTQKAEIGKVIVNSLSVPDMSSQDAQAAQTNNKLLKKSAIVFGMLIGIGIVIIAVMWYIYRFSVWEILKYSLLILVLVAVTEILFVTFVTKNYRLIDQNFLTYLIVTNLQKYANS